MAPKGPPSRSSPILARPFLVTAVRKSVHDMAELRQLCHALCSANTEAMNTLISTIHQMQELLQYTKSARAELEAERGGQRWNDGRSRRPN